MVNTNQLTCFHKGVKAFPRHHSHPCHARGILWIGPEAVPSPVFKVPILRLTGDKQVSLVDTIESERLKKELAEEGWFARARDVVDVPADDGDDGETPLLDCEEF